MKMLPAALALLAATACLPSAAGDFQPVEAGILPLKERLAVVKDEILSLRRSLLLGRLFAEKPEADKRLASLEAEEKQLAAEIESVKKQPHSPYITYATPPSEAK